MSYHWLRAGSEEVVQFDGARTPFPAIVSPGRTVKLEANVVSPGQPGAYTLVWDVVHETRAWLSTEGVTPARTHVVVTGAPVDGGRNDDERGCRRRACVPARPMLWSAALRIAARSSVARRRPRQLPAGLRTLRWRRSSGIAVFTPTTCTWMCWPAPAWEPRSRWCGWSLQRDGRCGAACVKPTRAGAAPSPRLRRGSSSPATVSSTRFSASQRPM